MSAARPRQGSGRGRNVTPRSRSARHLLGASLMILVGAFLPWIHTGVGNILGFEGPGLVTMYAAFLGIAGAIVRSPRVVSVHAALVAVPALVLPVWQVARFVTRVGFEGWMPGAGAVLTFGGGVIAAVAAVRLWQEGTRARG